MINVCIAGATGWAGRALVSAVLQAEDLALRSAVSRSAAGADLGSALGPDALDVPVYATVAEALDGVDVLVDYTSHEAVKANTFTAIEVASRSSSARRARPPTTTPRSTPQHRSTRSA